MKRSLRFVNGFPRVCGFIGYGHRVSFGYVAADAVSRYELKRTLQSAAKDVAAWDQLGCLSPHVFYVEHGGSVSAEKFAEMLADEFAALEATEPRGKIATEEAAAIASKRSFYEVRAATAGDVKLWQERKLHRMDSDLRS